MKRAVVLSAVLLPALVEAAPAQLHLRATYLDGRGGSHRLEVWRDGDRLRRDTDERLSLYVQHDRNGEDRYRVIDRTRNFGYSVARTNLYRLGTFVDWTSLTTLLSPALRRAALRPTAEPDVQTAAGRCRWLAAPTSPEGRVCWSRRFALPLLIKNARGETVVTVEKVEIKRPASSTFAEVAGVLTVDADRDISPDD
jgi:hypothetical protein